MLFNSSVYIFLFLPVTLLSYFIIAKSLGKTASKIWLLSASLFFYGYWKAEYLALIITSIFVNYIAGKFIVYSRTRSRAKLFLISGILFNTGLLVYFKYAGFVATNIGALIGGEPVSFEIILPLAISFFTFQQIAYLSDIYLNDRINYSFIDYSLFICFFPQLIAGPIVHHKEVMPYFSMPGSSLFNANNIAKGIFIFCIGLFKNIVIADTISTWASAGFDSSTSLTFFDAWGVSLCYTFQLYYDFSGYSDMAIGAALMFNIRLPANFHSPYKALSIRDFWRRWHMTLSRWLRDYVYIPLGGNRKTATSTHMNIFLTFLVGGIWHGAGWTYGNLY